MASCATLCVQLSGLALEVFSTLGVDVSWDCKQERKFQCRSGQALTIQDVADTIAGGLQVWYMSQTGGEDRIEVRVRSVRPIVAPEKDIPFADPVEQHLTSGDTIIAELLVMTDSMMSTLPPQEAEFTDEELQLFRDCLRFGVNDRVLCNCGPRWLAGHIVGTAVPDANSITPYLVKTDPLLGIPSKTIKVSKDTDDVCTQETCFDACKELHLTRSAAHRIGGSCKPKLRFNIGDAVVCRVRNNVEDGLEQWVAGQVSLLWPTLPTCAVKHHACEVADCGTCAEVAGMFDALPDVVPYKIDLEAGSCIYCHRDHHTLIRRHGMQPHERVRGISKRIEGRTSKDGGKERIDHETGRCKRMLDSVSADDT